MGAGSADEKARLRERMRERLRGLEWAEREERSRRIREALMAREEWARARVIGLFAPMVQEPDLEPLWGVEGKRFCVPRVAGEGLEFRAVERLEELVVRGRVREPDALMHSVVAPEDLGLVLVPGLAFSAGGERLGRGGGYYDRFLAGLPEGVTTIGVAFAFQLVEAVPVEAHDAPVSRVVCG